LAELLHEKPNNSANDMRTKGLKYSKQNSSNFTQTSSSTLSLFFTDKTDNFCNGPLFIFRKKMPTGGIVFRGTMLAIQEEHFSVHAQCGNGEIGKRGILNRM